RLFGNDEERTSLFIPHNARGPSDPLTDRRAAVGEGATATTDPVQVRRGFQDEITNPLAQSPQPPQRTARRPTPGPMKVVAPALKAEPPTQSARAPLMNPPVRRPSAGDLRA